MVSSRHRHVIWDWNGTLLDDVALCVDIVNLQLAGAGRAPLTIEQYRERFTFPVPEFYRAIGFEITAETMAQLGTVFHREYGARYHLHPIQPNGREVLTRISESGRICGSVSGGCVENEVYTEAREVLATGEPKLLSFAISDDEAWSVGLPCGGEIDVFVERLE